MRGFVPTWATSCHSYTDCFIFGIYSENWSQTGSQNSAHAALLFLAKTTQSAISAMSLTHKSGSPTTTPGTSRLGNLTTHSLTHSLLCDMQTPSESDSKDF